MKGSTLKKSALRYWLGRNKPHAIKAVDADGVEHDIAIGAEQVKWAHAARSILAVNAIRVIAYNQAGQVLVTCTLDDDGDEDTTPEEPPEPLATIPLTGHA